MILSYHQAKLLKSKYLYRKGIYNHFWIVIFALYKSLHVVHEKVSTGLKCNSVKKNRGENPDIRYNFTHLHLVKATSNELFLVANRSFLWRGQCAQKRSVLINRRRSGFSSICFYRLVCSTINLSSSTSLIYYLFCDSFIIRFGNIVRTLSASILR